MGPPTHWPKDLVYLQDSKFHTSVSESAKVFVQPSKPKQRPGSGGNVRIRPITASEHPALGQFGLFAARKIPPNTRLVDYIGTFLYIEPKSRRITCTTQEKYTVMSGLTVVRMIDFLRRLSLNAALKAHERLPRLRLVFAPFSGRTLCRD